MKIIVLAGGSGTRFWPVSRQQKPKQLISLYGGKTMIEHTLDRVGHVSKENVFVVLGAHLDSPTKDVIGDTAVRIIEPAAKNTAPAIALGAVFADLDHADDVIVVLPSDHFVADISAFQADLDRAATLAESGYIVTIGIPPTHPETGYGYIDRGAKIDDSGFVVNRFVEKPNRETAITYLSKGTYLWNAGMFVFKPSTLFAEMERQMPEMAAKFTALALELSNDPNADFTDMFASLQSISIDYGIMENATKVAVIPATFAWSDVGHWDALPSVQPADEHGNVTIGNTYVKGTNNIVASYSDRFVAVVGVDGLVVVETTDAVLVIPRDQAQDVREVVDYLKTTDPSLI